MKYMKSMRKRVSRYNKLQQFLLNDRIVSRAKPNLRRIKKRKQTV